jgi:pSer/pThr/pTyr-binding forkhead associated (FHA) protein
MLFIPPLPPVQLPEQGTVTLGRSSSCELRLHDVDTSRRHAEIVCEAGDCTIRDLESTNGTFVNGERVETHKLEPGDRIQIGSNAIAFCHVESDLERDGNAFSAGEAKTVLVERPVLGRAFQGDLAQIPPFAVVQILEMGRKSGVLEMNSDGAPGHLWFRDGDPIHAETKDQVGFDAAIALVFAKSGRFTFEPSTEFPKATIQASVTQLLLEASRQIDEGRF